MIQCGIVCNRRDTNTIGCCDKKQGEDNKGSIEHIGIGERKVKDDKDTNKQCKCRWISNMNA